MFTQRGEMIYISLQHLYDLIMNRSGFWLGPDAPPLCVSRATGTQTSGDETNDLPNTQQRGTAAQRWRPVLSHCWRAATLGSNWRCRTEWETCLWRKRTRGERARLQATAQPDFSFQKTWSPFSPQTWAGGKGQIHPRCKRGNMQEVSYILIPLFDWYLFCSVVHQGSLILRFESRNKMFWLDYLLTSVVPLNHISSFSVFFI